APAHASQVEDAAERADRPAPGGAGNGDQGLTVRIVFFGTPEFAVPSLRALLGEGFDVAAVVTQPDKPQGRSRSALIPPPVKAAAQEEGLAVLQPERPTDPDFVRALAALEPELGIVVAYGHILKPALLAIPK